MYSLKQISVYSSIATALHSSDSQYEITIGCLFHYKLRYMFTLINVKAFKLSVVTKYCITLLLYLEI